MITSPFLNEQNLPLFDGYEHGTALIFWWRSQIFTAPPLLHLHYLQRPLLCNLRKLEAEPQKFGVSIIKNWGCSPTHWI